MDINATLIGQMITFAVFVIFTMKYVWPPLTKALQDREKKIADGLAAAERGEHSLQLAQHKAVEILQQARESAAKIAEDAQSHAADIISKAKDSADVQAKHIIANAQADIKLQITQAQQQLQKETVDLGLEIAKKVVGDQMRLDEDAQRKFVEKLVERL